MLGEDLQTLTSAIIIHSPLLLGSICSVKTLWRLSFRRSNCLYSKRTLSDFYMPLQNFFPWRYFIYFLVINMPLIVYYFSPRKYYNANILISSLELQKWMGNIPKFDIEGCCKFNRNVEVTYFPNELSQALINTRKKVINFPVLRSPLNRPNKLLRNT